jgi:hypothetical protein
MTKAAKLNNFTSTGTHKETALDKTTRIVVTTPKRGAIVFCC